MLEMVQGVHPVLLALFATLFTWALTAAGAAMIFLPIPLSRKALDGMLGFAAGVMMAASYWSLLAPAIEMTVNSGSTLPSWLPAAAGFLTGAVFLRVVDKFLPHLHPRLQTTEGVKTNWQRSILLVLAITLHNIPEGLAVGVAFGAVASGLPEASLGGAIALALGIGIQNFPEGTAVSLPLYREGLSKRRSFMYGQLSGVVEPIAGVLGALAVVVFQPILPFALAFAAGAMIFVVVEELIPESQAGGNTDFATMGAIAGFTVMMILDVALG
ncbi:MAG: ZIP family metal transporter [Kiritimatiellae bacterium]|nr:ZIP family metal transporter [Kiritimatiellia bacterium]